MLRFNRFTLTLGYKLFCIGRYTDQRMANNKDNYTPAERKEYNRHYYPNNRERIAESKRSPIALRRRKILRVRKKYELKIKAILEQMAAEIAGIDTAQKLSVELNPASNLTSVRNELTV